MMKPLIPLAAMLALLLGGCQETRSDTSKDVAEASAKASAEARTDSSEARKAASASITASSADVARAKQEYAETDQESRKKLTDVEATAMIEAAKARFDVEMTDAQGRHDVAAEQCDALSGVDKQSCLGTAAAVLASEQATATATRDAALVRADQH